MSQGVRGGLTPRRLVAHTLSAPPWRRIGAELATVRMLSYLAGEAWAPVVVPHSVRWPAGESARRIAPGVWAASPDLAMSSTPSLIYGHIPFVDKARRHADSAGVPLVMAAHGGPPGWLAAQVAAAAPDLVVANSETMAVGLRRTKVPVHVQRPPVFGEDSAQDPEGVDHYPTFVTLVNGSKDKGGEIVAQIARRMPDLRFLVVTGGYGEQVTALRSLPNVETLEHQGDMRTVWARTAVLLVPSVEESWGMAAVEAMAAGIPVLGSPALGLHECLGDVMPRIPLNDVDAWCSAIHDALGPLREHLHVAALRRAFELDPAPGLRATHRRLAGLTGWDVPMGNLRYRNVRTGEVVDVDPGSPAERRLERLSLVWAKVEDTAPPTPVTGEQAAGSGEPDADPALVLPPPPAPPKVSARLADWQEYAIARGGDPAAVKAAPKGALVALYG